MVVVDLNGGVGFLGRLVPPVLHSLFPFPCCHVITPHCVVYCPHSLRHLACHIHLPSLPVPGHHTNSHHIQILGQVATYLQSYC